MRFEFPSSMLAHLEAFFRVGAVVIYIGHANNEIVGDAENFISQISQFYFPITVLLKVKWVDSWQTKYYIFHKRWVIIVVTDED